MADCNTANVYFEPKNGITLLILRRIYTFEDSRGGLMTNFFNTLKYTELIRLLALILCVTFCVLNPCFGGVISVLRVTTFIDYNTRDSYYGGPGYNYNYNYRDLLSINLGYLGSGSALAFCTVSAGSGGSYTNRKAKCAGQEDLSYRIYNAPYDWNIPYDALDRPPTTASEWNHIVSLNFTQSTSLTTSERSYGVLVAGGQYRTPGSVFTDQVVLTVWFMGESGPIKIADYPISIRIQIARPPSSISVNSGNGLLSLSTISPGQKVPLTITYSSYGGHRITFASQKGALTHQSSSVLSKLSYKFVSTTPQIPFTLSMNGTTTSSTLLTSSTASIDNATITGEFVMPESTHTMVSGTYTDLVTFSVENL
jgi:hypothetical protein